MHRITDPAAFSTFSDGEILDKIMYMCSSCFSGHIKNYIKSESIN